MRAAVPFPTGEASPLRGLPPGCPPLDAAVQAEPLRQPVLNSSRKAVWDAGVRFRKAKRK